MLLYLARNQGNPQESPDIFGGEGGGGGGGGGDVGGGGGGGLFPPVDYGQTAPFNTAPFPIPEIFISNAAGVAAQQGVIDQGGFPTFPV